MARRSSRIGLPPWFRQRWLIEAEAVLLVGVVQELAQRQVSTLGLPNWGRTLWTMGCVLGVLGGLIMVLRLLAQRSLARAHRTAQALPLPFPYVLLHATAFAGLFLLYAWVWHFWPVVGHGP